jgi:folylpolyglutamate synthase/dihydropteroate synthase
MIFFLPKKLDKFSKKVFKDSIKKNNAKLIEVDNIKGNYQQRNKKMANALYKYIFGENIIKFNTPFGRTTIEFKNNINYIYDVGHNYDAINESLKLLVEKNIKFDQVILSLSNNKEDKKIYKLFDCNINIFKHNGLNPKKLKDYKKGYHQKLNSIEEVKSIKSKIGILYIGSFYFINDLLKDEIND